MIGGRRPEAHGDVVQPIVPSRPARRSGSWLDGAMLGGGLVAAGFVLAFLTLETSLASRLVTGGAGARPLPFGAIVWWLGLVAGAALLIGGTNRLAIVADAVRRSVRANSAVARALAGLPSDSVVVGGVVPHDGRPVPTLVVGPFGVAVVEELASGDRLRRVDASWQERTPDGWTVAEHPVDRTARDADRVRHWLTHGELGFVVRVYAALVTADATIPRSPLCAVISADQLGSWIEGLPGQRSLTEARRHRLVARARDAVVPGRRDW